MLLKYYSGAVYESPKVLKKIVLDRFANKHKFTKRVKFCVLHIKYFQTLTDSHCNFITLIFGLKDKNISIYWHDVVLSQNTLYWRALNKQTRPCSCSYFFLVYLGNKTSQNTRKIQMWLLLVLSKQKNLFTKHNSQSP